MLKGTPLRSGRVKDLNRNFSKANSVLVPAYQHVFCGTLICLLSILVTRFQMGMYQMNWETSYERFSCINIYNTSFHVLTTDKRRINVPQDRLLCPSHAEQQEKVGFEKNRFKCVTRPDFSGVPIRYFG